MEGRLSRTYPRLLCNLDSQTQGRGGVALGGPDRPCGNALASLPLDLERDGFLDRGQPRLGDVDRVKVPAGVLVHSGYDEVDVVMGSVAVNRGDPAQLAATGFLRQASHRRAGQTLQVKSMTPLGGDDQPRDRP